MGLIVDAEPRSQRMVEEGQEEISNGEETDMKCPITISRLGMTLVIAVGLFVTVSCAGSTHSVMKRQIDLMESDYSGSESTRSDVQETGDGFVWPDSTDLYALLRFAAKHNPEVEASFYRWKAAVERIPQASAPPDPRLRYGHYFEAVETRVGPQNRSIGLSQVFPWFGTLRLKGSVATHDARIAEQQFLAAQDRLYLEVVTSYAEYYHLLRMTEFTTEIMGIVSNAESVANARYRDGSGAFADLIRAQIKREQLLERLAQLADRRRPVTARLNAALNRPALADLPSPQELPDETLALDEEQLTAMLMSGNPNLRAAQIAIGRADDAVSLASRKRWPTITLGIDYLSTGAASMSNVVDSGKDPIIGRLGLSIPIWQGKHSATRRAAVARRRSARLMRISQANQLSVRLKETLFRYDDADRKIELYQNSLIPKARESIRALLAAYTSGEVGFLDFLDAERLLWEFSSIYERARADRLIHLAELRMLTGGAYDQMTETEVK